MADVFITGHKGYIGTHLCQRLPGFIGCDLKEGQDYRLQKNGIHNTVVHLAASVSVTESFQSPEEYINNNALGLIPFLQNNRIGRFILISTGGAMYGNARQANESDAAWNKCLSPYAQSKFLAEQIVKANCPEYVILRLANVYGGDMSVRGEASAHAHFANDNPITVYGGYQTRDFVHIDVVCEAIVRAMNDDFYWGTYNIGSGVETSVLGLANEFGVQRNVMVGIEPERPGEVQHISLDVSKAREAKLL